MLVRLIVSAVASLVLAFGGAYLIVVSQNPASSVSGPAFVYGTP